ncbi:MAG TPA: hypothetical protein VMZ92_22045 [Planctomycetota bacterium]|nr:hypothetical protein [Planctomycetota bacterium]
MDYAVPIFILFVLLLMVGAFAWRRRRSASMVDRWADENNLQIIGKELRCLRRGPFWWHFSGGYEVYRVILRDDEGRERKAYVRCGNWLFGLFSNQVKVEWDDEDDARLEVSPGD